eukprot:CCRYP_006469-RA/>CCRYP_006469-RA protein AED:0.20 eAED:0.84 QI:0/0/0/1/0/0/3/0/79
MCQEGPSLSSTNCGNPPEKHGSSDFKISFQQFVREVTHLFQADLQFTATGMQYRSRSLRCTLYWTPGRYKFICNSPGEF